MTTWAQLKKQQDTEEKALIVEALKANEGYVRRACEALDITYNHLWRLMEKYEIKAKHDVGRPTKDDGK